VALYGATAGKTAILEVEAATNQAVCAIFPQNDSFDSQFLQFELIHLRPKLLNARAGGAQPNISQTVLGSFDVILPPLPEQRAIARVLRAVQEVRELRKKELQLERERKAALMQHLFTHGTRGEARKQTEIGEMPESWKVSRLGDLAELITKGSSPNWQGFEYRSEGIPFVRSQNVGWGRLETDEIAYLPESFNLKEKKSIIRTGDLLVNIVGASIGRAATASEIVSGGNLNQAVALVRCEKSYNSMVAMHFLLTEAGQSQLHRQKKDIARANLSLQDIENLYVPVPNSTDQKAITEILDACETKIAAIEKESVLLGELFYALLEELVTGRLSAVPLID
jgi:type I restriction enzyme, S subunit